MTLPFPFLATKNSGNSVFMLPRKSASNKGNADIEEEEVLVFSAPPIGTIVRGVFMPTTTTAAMPNGPSSSLVLPPINTDQSSSDAAPLPVLPSLIRSLDMAGSSCSSNNRELVVVPKAIRPLIPPPAASKVVSIIKKKRESTAKNPCPHGKYSTYMCKECGGAGLCVHDKRKDYCKVCSKSICPHGKVSSYYCRECKGRGCCEHGRSRYYCGMYVFFLLL